MGLYIVAIEKMKVQSDAVLKQMEESRKTLLAEATAYAIRTKADTEKELGKLGILKEIILLCVVIGASTVISLIRMYDVLE